MTEYVSSFLSLFLSGQSLDNMLLPCTVVAIFLSALLSYFVCVHLLTPLMHFITLKTETEWDDDLLDRHMLSAFSQLAPALLLLWLLPEVAHKSEAWKIVSVLHRVGSGAHSVSLPSESLYGPGEAQHAHYP